MPELNTNSDLKLTHAKKTLAIVLIPTVGTKKQLHKTQRALISVAKF